MNQEHLADDGDVCIPEHGKPWRAVLAARKQDRGQPVDPGIAENHVLRIAGQDGGKAASN